MGNMESGDIKLHRRFIKSYRKNTIAIFFSFVLTFMLLTTMLVLMHTNHRIANIQDKTIFTPSDCYISGLSGDQVEQLKEDKDITHLAVELEGRYLYQRNNQNVFLTKGDDTAMTMMAAVLEGRLPDQKGEVAAERWVLLNLGITPVLNQEFVVENPDTGEETKLKLVGILSDIFGNKKYGSINLYTPLEKNAEGPYTAYVRFNEKADYDKKTGSLKKELDVQKKQIKVCPAREDFRELYQTDFKVISILLVICMIIFYGIYRITTITREKQYGILRAVGMKKTQLQKMILLELYEIFGMSLPVGIGLGLLLSLFIVFISGDKSREIYLYQEKVEFMPVVPVWLILICVILAALLIGVIGYFVGRSAVGGPVTEIISGAVSGGNEKKSLFLLKNDGGKGNTLFHMGCKYIIRDLKTSSFAVLTICLGVVLFTGLAYKAQLLEVYRDDTKEMWYLNGQYAMTMQHFGSWKEGLSRESAAEIESLKNVTSVKTEAGLPIRVIDDEPVKRIDSYYDELNGNLKELYGYENTGYDGKNQVYKSTLYGYNTRALQELKKYVISGDFNPENMKEDEIILSVLYMDKNKNNNIPGAFKDGTPLMEYQTGDEIQIKYRADGETGTEAYEKFEDGEDGYICKTYKIAAIVSFQYMYDCNRIVYPLLITSDSQIQKIAPDGAIQCMYADGLEGMSLEQQMDLEEKLISICSKNNNISTRSLISEIKQNEMFYHKQMIYVYGIAVVSFILVMINIINNLRYRMQTRTREVCMLRAIGMSVVMTKKMLLMENVILSVTAVAAAFLLSQPTLRILYSISDMKAYGHVFRYDYRAFAAVSGMALVISVLLSFGILKSWKSRQIVEGMGKIE